VIITRTPCRATLFGSSTDHPSYFKEHGGISVNFAINKYSWMSVKKLNKFFDYNSKFSYSEVECVKNHSEIKHNIIRSAVQFLGIKEGIDLVHQSDIFSRAGIGSSSTFAVALINTLSAYRGEFLDKSEISRRTIYLEQEILRENVGLQDTICATYGSILNINYHTNGHFSVNPIFMSGSDLENFQDHLLLLFTGEFRTSHDIQAKYKHSLLEKENQHKRMVEIANAGIQALQNGNIKEVGRLLNATWEEKRQIIGPQSVDTLYEISLANGAYGFKLLGAGGGGSILILVPPEKREKVKKSLGLMEIDIKIDYDGSKILYVNRGS
jgi:D-glycero-alpha-D-manno-heptose-7-phosphate kinase